MVNVPVGWFPASRISLATPVSFVARSSDWPTPPHPLQNSADPPYAFWNDHRVAFQSCQYLFHHGGDHALGRLREPGVRGYLVRGDVRPRNAEEVGHYRLGTVREVRQELLGGGVPVRGLGRGDVEVVIQGDLDVL